MDRSVFFQVPYNNEKSVKFCIIFCRVLAASGRAELGVLYVSVSVIERLVK